MLPSGFARSLDRAVRVLVTFVLVVSGIGWESRARPALAGPALEGPAQITSEPPTPTTTATLAATGSPTGLSPSATLTVTAATEAATATLVPPTTSTPPAYPGPTDAPTALPSETLTPATATVSVTPSMTATLQASGTPTVTATLPATGTITSTITTAGGQVTFGPNDELILDFPAQAVSETIYVAIAPISTLPQPFPSDVIERGYAVDVRLSFVSNNAPLSQTELPVGVVLRQSDVFPSLDANSQRLLAFYHYDTAQQAWQRLMTDVSPATGIMTATTSSFSPIAVGSNPQTSVGDYSRPWQPVVPSYAVDIFSGAVTWNIPIDVPAGRGGLKPNMALSYNSAAVSEMRGKSNPQTPGIGMGWSLNVPYIERVVEWHPENMWKTPKVAVNSTGNYRIVMDGLSSDLVCVNGANPCFEFRTKDDKHWKLIRKTDAPLPSGWNDNTLTREYWLLISPDGTKYRFGYARGGASDGGNYSAWFMYAQLSDQGNSIWPAIWRWNLDLVEDTSGNSIWYSYDAERRGYQYVDGTQCLVTWSQAGCTTLGAGEYVRGGHLKQIDWSGGFGSTDGAYRLTFSTTTPATKPYAAELDQDSWRVFETFYSKKIITAINVLAAGPSGYSTLRTYTINSHIDTTGDRAGILQLDNVQIKDGTGTQVLPQQTFTYLGPWASYRTGSCSSNDAAWDKLYLNTASNGYGAVFGFIYARPDVSSPKLWVDGSSNTQYGQICDSSADGDGRLWLRERVRQVNATIGGSLTQTLVYEYRNYANNGADSGTWLYSHPQYPWQQPREFRGHPTVRVFQIDRWAGSDTVVAYQDHFYHRGLGDTPTGVCGESVSDADGNRLRGIEYKTASYDKNNAVLDLTQTRYLSTDLGNGRRFVAPASVCDYPNNGSGLFSRTDYTYDSYGNVARVVQQGDTARTWDESTTERSYVYNTTDWIVNRVLTESVFTGDSFRLTETRYAYDHLAFGQAPTDGLLTKVEQGLDGWGWSSTTAKYDTWANPTVVTDALQHKTQTGYDSVFHQFPVTVTNALNQPSYLQWNTVFAAPEVITATNGAVSRLEYDTMGRLKFVYDHGQTEPTLRYTYPSGSAWTAPWAIRTEQRIDAYASTAAYQSQWTFYDGLGRPVQTQTQAENNWLIVQSTAYDALGRPMTVTLPYTVTNAGGTYVTPNWALTMTVTTYDALGRVVQVAAADGTVTKKAYSNWEELVLDANGHQTQSERDGLGRLIVVREYTGTYASLTWNISQAYRTRYWYDALGRLFAVRDALGNTTRIEYDPLGRKVSMDDPSMGHWTYGYDLAGNLTRQTDAVGNVLTFTYDALNRLITKVGSPVGGAPATLAEYAYDAGAWAVGHRTAMTDTSGVSTWTYDPLGRMLAETRAVAGGLGTYTTGWAYDAAGRVVTQTYPTGEEVVTAYNLRGLPVGVDSADIAPGYLTAATYNTLGQITTQNWGNTLATSYSYDAKNARLLQIQLGSLLDLRYRYDKIGNILAITSTVNSNQVQSFTYDARDRLLTAQTNTAGNGQYNEAYGYNAQGNIITRTISGAGQTYFYGRPSAGGLTNKFYLPLVMSDGAAEFDDPTGATFGQPFAVISTTVGYRANYDLNGNQTLRVSGGITYTQAWDVENRLAVVTNTVSGQVTTFTYDGDGNRVRQTVGSATTLYIGSIYEKAIASGTVTTYYYAGGQRIALRQGGTVSWLSGDHLGSTTLTTNGAGAKTSELLYSPFGTTRYSWNTTPTSYQFTGQRRDTYTELIFLNARYYDPALGRFLSADPIVPGSTHIGGDGAALSAVSYAPIEALTVDFHAPMFLGALNAGNQFRARTGFRHEPGTVRLVAGYQSGPLDPQMLNRFAYGRNNPLRYTDPSGYCIWDLCIAEGIGLIEVAAVLGAAYIINEYYIGPNAAQNREVLASSMESVADELVNGINALFARGEYVPPGLTQDERNAYREAVHRYKRGYNIPADVDVPREILDQIAEAIQDGLSSREAADQADPPPEPDLDELDE